MARSKKRGQNRLFREAVIEPTGGGGPLLRLDHISKLFGSFRAVDDLSLDIEPGEVFALQLRGVGRAVVFDHARGAFEARALIGLADEAISPDMYYVPRLRFLEV